MFKKLKTQIGNKKTESNLAKQYLDVTKFDTNITIREKSVLIIETNPYHAETIPGHCKYFSDLGYNVDVFILYENHKEKPFCRYLNNPPRVFVATEEELKLWAKDKRVSQYDFIFFNSYVYKCKKYVENYLGNISAKYGTLGIEHDILSNSRATFKELDEKIYQNRCFVLSNIKGISRINPHYFGDIKITPKHQNYTVFTAVGVIDSSVKNHDLLLNAVDDLIKEGYTDFKVVVVGNGKLDIPQHLKPYIEMKGRLTFPDMYDCVENTDFLLALLDPENPSHKRYLQGQTSGVVQLSLGFKKPLIINDTFGTNYEFSNDNALMYSDNLLKDAMIEAIKQSSPQYTTMQESLTELSAKIYKQSINNLENAINNIYKQTIPIVFAFNDNYALPASIAIKSLVDNKKASTHYDIFIMHGGLKKETMHKIENIAPINWIYVDPKRFTNVPTGWSGIETYYRLLVADLIPNYDRIVWSDVDVLFKCDLQEIYNYNFETFDWAGVAAERQDEQKGIHTHFKENKNEYIYMPGFMVINAKKWRDENKVDTFFKTIRDFGSQLKLFDLDVLNLSCDNIKPISFDYCVLENIYDSLDFTKAPEYPWLSNVYTDKELQDAIENPMIIHYAGRTPKTWLLPARQIPKYYWDYIEASPFYNSAYYFPKPINKLKKFGLWLVIKLCPVKKWRKKLKKKLQNMFA